MVGKMRFSGSSHLHSSPFFTVSSSRSLQIRRKRNRTQHESLHNFFLSSSPSRSITQLLWHENCFLVEYVIFMEMRDSKRKMRDSSRKMHMFASQRIRFIDDGVALFLFFEIFDDILLP